jgi:predicted nuclease of predicted toxin-antitoxin system
MRLLIDENLSPRLALALADSFPGSIHVRDVGLKGADDLKIWSFAADHDYAILSKDDDFKSSAYSRALLPR